MDSLPHALQLWDNAARLSLPWWLYIWLGLLLVTFLASLLFVRNHPAARWALAGFAVSHSLVIGLEALDVAVMRKGLVSITHIIGWTPALIALVRTIPKTEWGTPFGVWCRALTFIIAVSLVFDVRDAIAYLTYFAQGHPVFAG